MRRCVLKELINDSLFLLRDRRTDRIKALHYSGDEYVYRKHPVHNLFVHALFI